MSDVQLIASALFASIFAVLVIRGIIKAVNRASKRADWFSPLLLTVYVALALAFVWFCCSGVLSGLPDRSGR